MTRIQLSNKKTFDQVLKCYQDRCVLYDFLHYDNKSQRAHFIKDMRHYFIAVDEKTHEVDLYAMTVASADGKKINSSTALFTGFFKKQAWPLFKIAIFIDKHGPHKGMKLLFEEANEKRKRGEN